MSHYTVEQIHGRRVNQLILGFDFPAYYRDLSDALIASAANGVGPDAAPSGVRRILTNLLPHADLAADIHDVEFALSDGKREAFTAANARFGHNCRLWVKANRSRFNPLRYIELFRISRDVEILDGPAGWSAWISAWKRRREGGGLTSA